MSSVIRHDVALLILRIGMAFLFLSAAVIHSKDAAGRSSTLHYTSLLFPGTATNSGLIKLCGFIAGAVLYLSGLGVLLGVELKISAFFMFLFSACGVVIHIRDGSQAFAAATALEPLLPSDAVAVIRRVKGSAMAGNGSSAIKNIPVMAAAMLLMIEGGGRYGFTPQFALGHWW